MARQPKKMVMIPFETLTNLSQVQLQKPENRDPNLRAMNSLEAEMAEILNNGHLSAANKLALYYQLFQRYNNIERQHNNATTQASLRQQAIEPPQHTLTTHGGLEHKRAVHNLLTYIPKNKRSKMRVLLDHLETNPLIDWDDKYEISVNGEPLQGSNLVDIVTDLSKDRGISATEPIGIKEFATALTNYNVPKSAILNPSRRHLFYPPTSSIADTDDNKPTRATPLSSAPRSVRRSSRKHAKKLDWDFYNQ